MSGHKFLFEVSLNGARFSEEVTIEEWELDGLAEHEQNEYFEKVFQKWLEASVKTRWKRLK